MLSAGTAVTRGPLPQLTLCVCCLHSCSQRPTKVPLCVSQRRRHKAPKPVQRLARLGNFSILLIICCSPAAEGIIRAACTCQGGGHDMVDVDDCGDYWPGRSKHELASLQHWGLGWEHRSRASTNRNPPDSWHHVEQLTWGVYRRRHSNTLQPVAPSNCRSGGAILLPGAAAAAAAPGHAKQAQHCHLPPPQVQPAAQHSPEALQPLPLVCWSMLPARLERVVRVGSGMGQARQQGWAPGAAGRGCRQLHAKGAAIGVELKGAV